jgi:hypothetical protein
VLDGDWPEGVGYWSYGISVSLLYADVLNKLTQSEFNLFEHDKLVSNPVTFALYNLIPPGTHESDKDPATAWETVNFQDSGHRCQISTFEYNKLAEAASSKEAIWLKNAIFGEKAGDKIFDIIWPQPNLSAGVPACASKHFRDYGWAVMRSDFDDPESFVLAGICGEQSDPYRESYFQTHGKLIAGHFCLYWRGEGYVWDVGSPGYPRDYWTRNRWNYVRANCLGHNVVMVNGEQQISDNGAGGRIIEFRSRDDRDYSLMDPTGAYPGEELKNWRRHLVLDKPDAAVVLDEITADKGDEVNVRFHSACDSQANGNILMINGAGGKMALIAVVDADWQFTGGEHILTDARDPIDSWSPGAEELKDRPFPFTDINFVMKKNKHYVVSVFVPVKDVEEAEDIAENIEVVKDISGDLRVAYSRGGKRSVLNFCSRKDGLLLKGNNEL